MRETAEMAARASPEAQGADGLQIVLGAQFAGGVAEEGGLRLGGGDAATVVGNG